MDNSKDQSYDDYRLRKGEILRGHNAYLKVLKSSVLVSGNFLKAFVNQESNPLSLTSETEAFRESPLFTTNVKVGFVVAKKKVRKAVLRNRIRRLLKESYRLNKKLFRTTDIKLNILFSISESGYSIIAKDPKIKFETIDREMKLLAPVITNLFKTK